MKYYIGVLKKYAVFNGRASRKEFWMFILFNVIFSTVAGILDGIIGSTPLYVSSDGTGYGFIKSLYIMATFLPFLAVSVRRLHDTSHSAKWLLMFLVPLVLAPLIKININVVYAMPIAIGIEVFLYLYFMAQDSTPRDNKYGLNPKVIRVD